MVATFTSRYLLERYVYMMRFPVIQRRDSLISRAFTFETIAKDLAEGLT